MKKLKLLGITLLLTSNLFASSEGEIGVEKISKVLGPVIRTLESKEFPSSPRESLVSSIPSGLYTVSTSEGKNLDLGILSVGRNPGFWSISAKTPNGFSSQQWIFTKHVADGVFLIRNAKYASLALDNSLYAGMVAATICNDDNPILTTQLWYLSGEGYLRSLYNNFSLSVNKTSQVVAVDPSQAPQSWVVGQVAESVKSRL